ncbi:hypothetical protein DOW24_01060 [Salmonella enterica subsp. enterica serovar Nigeria]|uniref:hypothetical protein n=1 Tax=Salmonella enterica TaxID=28901 RepID=UPI000D3E1F38|nr:hypothetical protein [Salmonella enterica]EBV4427907.1 hypothetical protein [Salmonella enterica subsp. enterica serovar Nigeria]EBY8534525.1 hypothetical protein [Salmonella enterica subsp. enterica serovar Telelkebir]ECB1778559.1 hypothetical protein [Salmonella enterica subsp. enterica serovar Kibi]ECE5860696.1 hypothetical protein [Salmonella enterica subsp. enterica]EDW2260652.1 hypothetical protein [Salmonella enterica subsp. enterica serovar Langford]EED8424394.1 hypothetical protei
MAELIQPKEFKAVDQDGNERTYIISKFPAIEGREIVCKYPLSAMPQVGDYSVNEETMLKLMSYVAIDIDGRHLPLTTRALVNNHCPDWEVLGKVEIAMMEYNVSFFAKGRSWLSSGGLKAKLLPLITKTLTGLSAQLSQKGGPRSTN